MSHPRLRPGTCHAYQPAGLGHHCSMHGCEYPREEWPLRACREARGEEDYRRFLERCVVADGRGAVIAFWLFVIVAFSLAALAWARYAGRVDDDEWVPQILSYQ